MSSACIGFIFIAYFGFSSRILEEMSVWQRAAALGGFGILPLGGVLSKPDFICFACCCMGNLYNNFKRK
ncbi:hypothetical protein ME1_00637, partial [Bartonella vinsonii subsp. arupensis OK-94-513]